MKQMIKGLSYVTNCLLFWKVDGMVTVLED